MDCEQLKKVIGDHDLREAAGVSTPATYAVVRTGRILTTMMVITDALPRPLLEAQLEKLAG